MRLQSALGCAMISLAVFCACSNDDGGSLGGNPTVVIAKATHSGDAQTGVVGAALTNSLQVLVTQDGNPKEGAVVSWAVTSGGGTVTAKDTTGADGIASASWTLGNSTGAQSVIASLAGASGSPVGFTATATAGPAFSVTKMSGDSQIAVLDDSFAAPVAVTVSDSFGNPVSGVTVNFVGAAGATASPPSVVTDTDGVASVTVTSGGAPGSATVLATAVGIVTPVTFDLTIVNAVREVTVGGGALIQFASVTNGSINPAVDTIAAGEGILWRWAGGSHSVESTGAPSFASSTTQSTVGASYVLSFPTAGTYQYQCAVHDAAMTGAIVVQ